jgi:polar amino acid transport system substrate-binding protein
MRAGGRAGRSLIALLLTAGVWLAACAPEPAEPEQAGEAPTADGCAKEELPLYEDGVLTIATDMPAFEPWFVKNDPSNGKGFEGAVAYAVAAEMGFSEDEVEWVVEPFNKSYAPGPKNYDFDINQISISAKRDKAVDFSQGYYDVNQALVALKDSPAADATSLAELADYKLGAQVGTTSYAYITQYIQPSSDPFAYDNTNDAKSALNAGQIDGIVVDLPTAFYISAVEIPGSSVVGQFVTQGETEQFGLLFEEGSPLIPCVNEALQRLEEDGTLAEIQDEWLSQTVAPILE